MIVLVYIFIYEYTSISLYIYNIYNNIYVVSDYESDESQNLDDRELYRFPKLLEWIDTDPQVYEIYTKFASYYRHYYNPNPSYNTLHVHYLWFGGIIPEKYINNIMSCYARIMRDCSKFDKINDSILPTKVFQVRLHLWIDDNSKNSIIRFCHRTIGIKTHEICDVIQFHKREDIYNLLENTDMRKNIRGIVNSFEHSTKPNYGAISDILRIVVVSSSFSPNSLNLYLDTDEHYCNYYYTTCNKRFLKPHFGMYLNTCCQTSYKWSNNNVILADPTCLLIKDISKDYFENLFNSSIPKEQLKIRRQHNYNYLDSRYMINYTVAVTGPSAFIRSVKKFIQPFLLHVPIPGKMYRDLISSSEDTPTSVGTFAKGLPKTKSLMQIK